MARRHILGAIGVAAVAVVALLAFAWRPAIAPIAPPAADQLSARAGRDRRKAGQRRQLHRLPYRAGRPGRTPAASRLHTKVGNFYSTNLTPDPETGIGAWSEAAFTRALREGVSRDGRHLFPVFPYTHYTQLTDADVRALYAYFMTRPPVKAPNRPNTAVLPARRPAVAGGVEEPLLQAGPLSARSRPATRAGTAAPISPKRWPAVPFATPTATSSARSRSAIPMPAR